MRLMQWAEVLRRVAAIASLWSAVLLLPAPADAGDPEGSARLPRLRVVVELDLATLPEGWLDHPAEVSGQRLEIEFGQLLLDADMTGRDFHVMRRYRSLPFVAAEMSVGEIETLARSPWVRGISGDDPLRPTLHESTGLVEAPRVWPGGLDGSGWTVAVLDTGVDATHPHLADKVVAEACFSANGSCPDASPAMLGPGAGAPCDYASACAHGTHVAGIAAGHSETLSGVAPGATLVAVQVFSRFDDGPYCRDGESCPLAYTSDLIAGLEHVYGLRESHAIAAVNMSLGGGYYRDQPTCDAFNAGVKAAIDTLHSVGIATVVASGNDGFLDGLGSPACISSAVSVGSINKSGDVSFFSNTSAFLSMLAPGGSILSSVPGGGFATMSGTSMATPHVSGAWAIMKQADPLASVEAVTNRLRKTGTQIDDPPAGITRRLIQLDGATAVTAVDALHDVQVRNLRKRRTLRPGQSLPIRWRATPGVASFDVSVTLDGGLSWRPIAAGLSATDKKIYWSVPRDWPRSNRVKLRVQGFDSTGEKVATDRNGAWLRYRP
ncbi:MAG: S8 family peptidase [Myxococcota bacterium]